MDREQRVEAEVLAFELEVGLAEVERAREWAFAQIASAEKAAGPLLEMTELRLAPTDAVRHLRELSGRPRDPETLGRILRRLGSLLRADQTLDSTMTRILYRISRDQAWRACAGDRLAALASFDDELELSRDGTYGDHAEVLGRLQVFLDEG